MMNSFYSHSLVRKLLIIYILLNKSKKKKKKRYKIDHGIIFFNIYIFSVKAKQKQNNNKTLLRQEKARGQGRYKIHIGFITEIRVA